MRWAQENEYPRFEHETPIMNNGVRSVFLEPEEDWYPEDESRISHLLGQSIQNPFQDFIRNKSLKKQQPNPQWQFRNLLYQPEEDKPQFIRDPFSMNNQEKMAHLLSIDAKQAEPQQRTFMWNLLSELSPKEYEVSHLEDAPEHVRQGLASQEESQKQKNASMVPDDHSKRVESLYQGMAIDLSRITENNPRRLNFRGKMEELEPLMKTPSDILPTEEVSVEREASSSGNNPLDNSQQLAEVPRERGTLPDKKWDHFSKIKTWSDSFLQDKDLYRWVVPQEQIIKEWMEEADDEGILSSPSPFRGENRINTSSFPPASCGIENLYDRDKSNLPPQLYSKINEAMKVLRGNPKINHLFSETEKGGKISFQIDPTITVPHYNPYKELIKVPADFIEKGDVITSIFEEIIHRMQHLVYGEGIKENSNHRAVETEAKMLQDLFTTENNTLGAMKVYNGRNSAYNGALYDFIERGIELGDNFFKGWGDQMSPIQLGGFKPLIDDKFSPKLLEYYYDYRIKK